MLLHVELASWLSSHVSAYVVECLPLHESDWFSSQTHELVAMSRFGECCRV